MAIIAMNTTHTLQLDQDEEQLARALTRDAWGYFSSLISNRDLFHVKEVPRIPRGGRFEITDDPDVVLYYLIFASSYEEEFLDTGWTAERFQAARETLCSKLEGATGIKRTDTVRAASEGSC